MSYKRAKALINDLERAKVAIGKVLLHKLKPYHLFDMNKVYKMLDDTLKSVTNQYNEENVKNGE